MKIYVIVFEEKKGDRHVSYIGMHQNIDRAYKSCDEQGFLNTKEWKWITSSEFSLLVWLSAWFPFTIFVQGDWTRQKIAKGVKK